MILKERMRMLRKLLACGVLAMAVSGALLAQSPVMTKIDPPNWWAKMPKAMLLVKGEHLGGAVFQVSDKKLRVEKTVVSENGHWAQLWLSGSPEKAETVQLVAVRGGHSTRMEYRFEERKSASEGFAGFSAKDVMYLIMTDRFADGDASNDRQPGDAADEKTKVRGWHGGDLRGVMEHLDYLQELGVTTVWMTPVYQNHQAESYHGYGATDMYAIDEHFGSLGDFKALAAALHARGMKLVLDTVPNHVGQKHPWVEDEPAKDWFHGTKAVHTEAQGDFAPLTHPHAAWRDQKNVTEGWFANFLPDMNTESPAVAAYLTQNAVWWVEQAGLDGLRLDTFPYVGRGFWQRFHAELHSLYPRLTTVGEIFNPDATITSYFASGATRGGGPIVPDTGLDTPFDFPSYFALREVFLKDAPMTKLAEVLRLDALYPHPERLVPFVGNHDTTRFLGEPGATVERLKLADVVLTTMRGMPQLYSGDEIAMRGGDDPDNRRDFPGGFGGSAASAFVASGRSAEQEAMLDWVKRLLKLRASRTELTSGDEQVLEAQGGVLVYVRGKGLTAGCGSGAARVVVIVNHSDSVEHLKIPTADTSLAGCGGAEVLWGPQTEVSLGAGAVRLDVAGGQAVVLGVQ